MKVTLNYQNITKFVPEKEVLNYEAKTMAAFDKVVNKTGEGNDFLGWVDYPINYDKEEYARIKAAAKKIQNNSQVLIVIGIGGSYLGAKAVIEALKPYFGNNNNVEIIFAGQTLSSTYMASLVEYVKDKDFSVNVISKSGTTTEPAVAFRIFKEMLEEKYGKDAKEHIFATTDKAKGALRTLSTQEGYETFIVPDDIGGRYSWFTAVGLLPIAAAGFDIDMLMKGAGDARVDVLNTPYTSNDCLKYAACRNLIAQTKKNVEILVTYEPQMAYVSEWWKQLFGESEGKNNLGTYPSSVVYSTDLHSLGQYVQEGGRFLYETVLHIENPKVSYTIKADEQNLDGLNYLAGKTMDYVNKMAEEGTVMAHVDGGVPNLMLTLDKVDEYNLGYLLYFFMFSCGVSCYLTGVNPFNQPGVESYKRNMFALLGKPGYEELTAKLKK